jgi:3-keto-5-aminohexanoate cleavage enzyme
MNFDEGAYLNTLPDIRYWAGRMREQNVRPELEIFEGGMINNALILAKEGVLSPKFIFNYSLGFKGALPANTYNMQFLTGMLPEGAVWGVVQHHMQDLSVISAAIAMGASMVRVGFEDSIFYAPGKMAQTNAELVRNIVEVINRMGYEVAAPGEAREILGLTSLK